MSLLGPIDHELVPPDRTLFTWKLLTGETTQGTWNEYQEDLANNLVDETGVTPTDTAMGIDDLHPGIEDSNFIPGVMPDGFSNI
jgi:hypothetical protein